MIGSGAEAIASSKQESAVAANPIRKVVTMLQSMQKKITAEGEKEDELFEKFMCYCKNGDEALAKSISAAETKIPAVSSEIEEAATFADLKADMDANIAAVSKATAAIEKGMA